MDNSFYDNEVHDNWGLSIENFNQLKIKQGLLRGILSQDFEQLSIIQKRGIVPLIEGRDTIAQALSGTGKTVTFSIGALQVVNEKSKQTQVLVLAPTRELAKQIAGTVQDLGQYLNVSVHICTGGTSVSKDKQALQNGVQIVVGTPGRVKDMIQKGFLQPKHLKFMVLDEADDLLSANKKESIRQIFQFLPENIQVGLFSATIPPGVLEITKQFMLNPAVILVNKEQLVLDSIQQYYIAIDKDDYKYEHLRQFFIQNEFEKCIIYCNNKRRVEELCEKLNYDSEYSSAIHADMVYEDIDSKMKEFRYGTQRILVTTNLLARGIQIQQVNLVINYDFPGQKEKDQYIHRIGRCGKIGKQGKVINLITPCDAKSIIEIEKYYNINLQEISLNIANIQKWEDVSSENSNIDQDKLDEQQKQHYFNNNTEIKGNKIKSIENQDKLDEYQQQQQFTNNMGLKDNQNKSIDCFSQLNLKENLLRGIYGYGFENPSTIQQKGIIPLIERKDTIGQAQSGTGKTATFSIGTLQVIDESSYQTQALILAPTRELAQQIYNVIKALGEYLRVSVYLSTKISEDKKAFKQGVQIVVGTPGRINDMITKGFLITNHLKIMIMDEADQLLAHGFKEQIRQIIQYIPGDIQIGLFSTTMPPEILEVTKQFMQDPAVILVKNEQLILEEIKQYYISIEKDEWKYETLKELIDSPIKIKQCIIYCNQKNRVQQLAQKLKEDGKFAYQIHSDTQYEEIDLQMKEFRCGYGKFLITTNKLARGIDVQQVSLVINYDLTELNDIESYIHRIGRSSRFRRKGLAISFRIPSDGKFLLEVEKQYKTKIEELPLDLSQFQ